MKRCGKCGIVKQLGDFHRRGRGVQTWCKACRKSYDALYHRRTRPRRLLQKRRKHDELVAWYSAIKSSTPCADCGGCFHPAAMTWDHLPGTAKVADVSSLLQKHNRRLILSEIEKCELVCANCHAVRTFMRRRDVAQPG